MNLKKELSGVAKVAAQIMGEQLKGQQHQIDKNKNNKIDAHDFAILRGEKKAVKKEEVEQIEELKKSTLGSYVKKAAKDQADDAFEHGEDEHRQYGDPGEDPDRDKDIEDRERRMANREKGIGRAVKRLTKEETIDEASYSAKAARAGKDIGKPGKMFSKIAASAAKKYGSEERGKKVADAVLAKLRMKEDVDHDITDEEVEEILTAYEETPKTFSEMMAAYKEDGLAFFAEEPTQDEYEKEIKKAQAKSEGKEKADVAKASVQAVKNEETHTKIQVIDMTDPNNIQKSEIDLEERTLTKPEAKKKEEIVKSMKKKMPGFKERYGERAKSVMYATATKLAKEEKEDHWQNGYDHVRDPIADEPYLDNARVRFNELKKNNPHKKGTPEHKEWHAGASTAYEEHKDMLKGH